MTDANPTHANTYNELERRIEDDEPQRTDPSAHHQIGTRTSSRYDLPSWLGENAGDPAFKVRQVVLH